MLSMLIFLQYIPSFQFKFKKMSQDRDQSMKSQAVSPKKLPTIPSGKMQKSLFFQQQNNDLQCQENINNDSSPDKLFSNITQDKTKDGINQSQKKKRNMIFEMEMSSSSQDEKQKQDIQNQKVQKYAEEIKRRQKIIKQQPNSQMASAVIFTNTFQETGQDIMGKKLQYGASNPIFQQSSVPQKNPLSLVIKIKRQWEKYVFPQYDIFYSNDNEYFFSAKVTGNYAITTLSFSTDPANFTENSQSYIGKIKLSFTGTGANIYGAGYSPKNSKKFNKPLRNMLASVLYEQNYNGSAKPRVFRAYIIKQDYSYYDLKGTQQYEKQLPIYELLEKYPDNDKYVLRLTTKQPVWCQERGVYQMHLGSNIKQASVKNFLLCDSDDQKNKRLLFGKINDDNYYLEIGHPLTPLVGAGIALTSFGVKIGCQ